MPESLRLSFVIPVLNEALLIGQALGELQQFRKLGHEVIVVDGGSQDDTTNKALGLCDKLLQCAPGRSRQMNHGAAESIGDLLVFLHVDSRLSPQAAVLLPQILLDPRVQWGRFDVSLSGRSILLPVVATAMNWRSRVTGVATGDQAIFVRRALFRRLGGFAPIALMEDVELSKRLRRVAPPRCLRAKIQVSARRWEQQGLLHTILQMWYLRLLYFLGVSPDRLMNIYYKKNY